MTMVIPVRIIPRRIDAAPAAVPPGAFPEAFPGASRHDRRRPATAAFL